MVWLISEVEDNCVHNPYLGQKKMNIKLAKELLSTIGLAEEQAVIEDLDVMARYKYDHYELYGPGARFFEHLYLWLKQFHRKYERRRAIEFIRRHLIFISQREMQNLARCVYYEAVIPEIIRQIIKEKGLGKFDFAIAYTKHFREYLRRCLFIGLSDGAQINFFRRHHTELSQEQILPYYRTSSETYLDKLREEIDPAANFWGVFLIDDFTASGYTLIREESDHTEGNPHLTGALQRVYEKHENVIENAACISVCHYISTEQTQAHIRKHLPAIERQMPGYEGKLKTYAAMIIPEEVCVRPSTSLRESSKQTDKLLTGISEMCDRYYDESFESENTINLGGIKYGFGNSGLPLVLYSNTPNNTIFLFWVNTEDPQADPAFNALFRRIDRHRARHEK